nr:Na+/H+ antiporter subunit D [Rubellimicrobium sp. CFH 75288]
MILVLPVVVPLATAILCFALRTSRWGRWVSLGGTLLHAAAAFALVAIVSDGTVIAAQMGNWAAPFGITLVADALGAAMVAVTAVTAIATAVYALGDIDAERERLGYHALFQVLIAGVSGAFLTGDIFNLYVWFEVMLIASFGLMTLGARPEQIDGGIRYVTLNLVSTILFLMGVGLLYGMTGTLNMADLSIAVASLEARGPLSVVAVMFILAFGIKSAVFPLFFWLPASYHTPAFAVSALFAGLLTKVGVYALVRMFTLVFDLDTGFTHEILLWVALLTMLTGVLGAAAQSDFRKILSFHIVSQIGYMVLGLALFTPLAIAGAVFYILHHILVKANLFLVAGVAGRLCGSTELARMGGLYRSAPLLAALFLVPAFSLAGFPPLSGFWAKFLIVKASLDIHAWLAATVALVTGILTVFSMTKIWGAAFWTPHPEGLSPEPARLGAGARAALILPIAFLASLTLFIGLVPQPLLGFAEMAGAQLLDPADYIRAVLGDLP